MTSDATDPREPPRSADAQDGPSPENQVKQAARLLASGEEAARRQGIEILEAILREYYGTPVSDRAWRLLHEDRVRVARRLTPPVDDQELLGRLRERVARINDPSGQSLVTTLDALFHGSVPDTEAFTTLRRDALERIESLLIACAERDIPLGQEVIGPLDAAVASHPNYRGALKGTLERVDTIQWTRRLDRARPAIEQALDQGDLGAAQAPFAPLRGLPPALAAARDTLSDRLLDLVQRCTRVQDALARVAALAPPAGRTWVNAGTVAKELARLPDLLAQGPLTTDLVQRVTASSAAGRGDLLAFIEHSARQCRTLTEAAAFNAALGRLPQPWPEQLDQSWFADLRDTLLATCRRGVSAAADEATLTALRDQEDAPSGLPPILTEMLAELDREIDVLAERWRSLARGAPDLAADWTPVRLAGALPGAFLDLQAQARTLESELDDWERTLAGSANSTELAETLAQLDARAGDWPDHARLQAQRAETDTRLWCRRCDDCLTQWRVEDLSHLLAQPPAVIRPPAAAAPYLGLQQYLAPLHELAAAVAWDPFATVAQAQDWWARRQRAQAAWSASERLPDALADAMVAEETRRLAQWLAQIEALLGAPEVPTETLHEAAAGLTSLALDQPHSGFLHAQKRLYQRAMEQSIATALGTGAWDQAADWLERLAHVTSDQAGLRGWEVRIAAGRATEQGPQAEAELWVTRFQELTETLGEQAAETLDRLLRNALEDDGAAPSAPLTALVRRALVTQMLSVPDPHPLHRVLAWVAIESALRNDLGVTALDALRTHYAELTPPERALPDRRLGRLTRDWMAARQDLGPVFVYAAFAHLREQVFGGTVKPLAALSERITEELNDLAGELGRLRGCRPDPGLNEVRERLAAIAAQWSELEDCLAAIPTAEPRPEPPEQLERLRHQCEDLVRLAEQTERLEHADFRRPETIVLLSDSVRLAKRLSDRGLGPARACRERIEDLAGLARLGALFKEFRDTAHSLTAATNLDESGVQARLVAHLRDMHDCLEAAAPAGPEQGNALVTDCRELLSGVGDAAVGELHPPSLERLCDWLSAGRGTDHAVDERRAAHTSG